MAEALQQSAKPLDAADRGVLIPVPVILVCATLVALSIDVRVAKFFSRNPELRFLSDILQNAEPFGHGVGVFLIVCAVFALDHARRRQLPWLLAGSFGAGLATNVIKSFVVRFRPRSINDFPESVTATFGGIAINLQSHELQSFPSGHTATAVGLAVMLTSSYPHGRWFFTLMAILVGLQRVVTSAHFPSDVFAGALVGWIVAKTCLRFQRSALDIEASSE